MRMDADTMMGIDELEEALYMAVEAAEQLAKALRENGYLGCAARIEAYTIPSLGQWLSSKNQPGSLASLRDEIATGDY